MTVDPAGSGAPMSDRMQSLLNRAAEDQLAEQRQLAGALADLRGQMQQIAGDVASLRQAGAAGGGPDEAALGSLSADIREAVRLLAERLDGVARLVQQRGSDLVELNAAVSSLQAAVRGQGEALGGIGNGLSALPSFGERIGGLQDNLGALHERLVGLEELNTGVGALQQRVEAVDHGLRELKSAFAAIGARMAELPGRADLDAAAGRSVASVAGLTELLEGMDRAIAALPDTIAGVAPPSAQPAAPDAELQRLGDRLDQLASTHRDSTNATADRLEALDQRLDQVLSALAPVEDEPRAGRDDEPEDDPVLAELAELREALVGEGGIIERLDADGDEHLDAKVSEAVAQAVADSEQRLTAHIDEAVLALADALLRRRSRGSARAPMAAAPASMAAAPVVTAAAPVAEPPAADEADEVDDEAADEPEIASEDSDAGDVPSWQTPPVDSAAEPAQDSRQQPQQAPSPEDVRSRRRPWWRPGD